MKKINGLEFKNTDLFIGCKNEVKKYTDKGWEVKEVSFWDYGEPTYVLARKKAEEENMPDGMV
ncbi:MAG: hypothetical protein BWY84_00664 [Candidatus Aerophobetes bacterium ADurb.Bin490]|nr:MAG: hypothetical protein BWY84_00664 [Candidatus Aerophobetes bacterium ADurb.Bin490]HPI04176.1 hypothetical protein [Candidatus Goldiibacteriota bacterium]HPN64400.1 hypothetical protein [Candidatus Goldiibacteriota bacterium]HRQ43656.1 hypothetical protein [Candidatus Goldiibacteriota bacterium]